MSWTHEHVTASSGLRQLAPHSGTSAGPKNLPPTAQSETSPRARSGWTRRAQPFYVCDHLHERQGEPRCQYLRFDRIDRHVVHGFFEALSVAEIDLAASTLDEADRRQDQLLAARRQDVERSRYQARLAER